MTEPITITTWQTEELIRKWSRANRKQKKLDVVIMIIWTAISIARIIMGIALPDNWMNWILVALAVIVVVLYIAKIVDPAFFHPTMTTTLSLSDQAANISMDKNGKTRSYSADWSKVHMQESAECYICLVNFRRPQIFRKEDLTACTVEELSAFLSEKLGKRYVKL